MKLTHIANFKLGRSIQGFYLCKEKKLRYTRSDDIYLDLIFTDSTGVISGKMWELVNNFQNRFDIGDPVAVKGKVSEYNDSLQLTVTQINKASLQQYGQYGFSLEKLVKQVDEPIIDLWQRLMETVKTIKSPLKDLIVLILKKYKKKIQRIPVSVNHNCPIAGGYLQHLVTTSEITVDILSHYPSLDKDLVLAGIMLHDIGKVKSINDALLPNYTDEGKLLGHWVLGRDIVLDSASFINNFPQDILEKLEHIILSYEGESEKGVATVPQFPEALFVHYINTLDRRLILMMDIIKTDSNLNWTSYQSIFKTELLKK